MSLSGKVLLAVLALVLGAARADAQVCGKDFYGPCLPEAAPVLKPQPAVDPMARSAFDEAAFAGGDGLIKAAIFSDVTGTGNGSVKSTAVTSTHDAPASPRRSGALEAEEPASDETITPIDPGAYRPGKSMAPVRTLIGKEPEAGTMVKVVAPASATGRLDWMSAETQKAPRYAMSEESYNHQSGLWEAAPQRAARTDLLEDAKRRNYIRPTDEVDGALGR